jgi:decaprenylphospho-beta-D-ribofuranose 2-oxidase
LANGEVLDLYPDGLSKNWFRATCAGLGLTGTILEADIKLQKIHSSYISCTNLKFGSLPELSTLLEIHDENHLYSVAWIDISGSYAGRGILSLGNHSRGEEIKHISRERLFKVSHPGKKKIFLVEAQT